MLEKGERFGRLVVESEGAAYVSPKRKSKHRQYHCLCDCGESKLVRESSLIYKFTESCGCLQKERHKEVATTHGLSHHPLFQTWFDMNRRCYDVRRKDFVHYGGRGITVCQRWRRTEEDAESGIISFIADMYPTYTDGLELERIEVNENYSPENCTWATRREQVINRRPYGSSFDTHYIEYSGKVLCISQWADEVGIRAKVLADRLGKLGWSVERALTTPLMKRGKQVCKIGEEESQHG